MWVSGIMQGLMWRAYNDLGFLEYSFVETVEAMHPYYIIRAFGGLLYTAGALIMAWNLWQTARGKMREEERHRRPGARPPGRGIRREPWQTITASSATRRSRRNRFS